MGTVRKSTDPIPDEYIVVLGRDNRGHVPETARTLTAKYGGTVGRTYSTALDGFLLHANAAAASALARDPQVSYIEENGTVAVTATQTGPVWDATLANGGMYTCPCPPWVTTPPLPWNLDRLDQPTLPLNGAYSYLGNGQGVTAYVIDSGIRTDHVEFTGRAAVGADFIGDGRNGQDCNGHGTHVAGLLGGTTYGVAKQVKLVAVRVIACTLTTTIDTVIAGVDWVTNDHQTGVPAVANMSIGGPTSQALNDAVGRSIGDGIVYSVAAGNDATDACTASPASVASAITVGASWIVDSRGQIAPDHPATFSNFGSCVDLWAPGQEIVSAWNTSPSASAADFGTSMASPEVAGMTAVYLSAVPQATPSEVSAAVIANASASVVNVPAGSTNRQLTTNFGGAPAPLRSNLLPNSAFEMGSTTPWVRRNLASGVSLTAVRSAARAQSGGWFAEASTAAANGSVSVDRSALPIPGQSYSAGMWVRSADGTPINGSLAIWGLGGTSESQTTRFTADGTWRFVTVPLDVRNTGHNAVRVEIYMDAIGKAYDFDTTQLVDAVLSNASFESGTSTPWKKINAAASVTLTTYANAGRARDGASFAEANSSAPGGSVGQDLAISPAVGVPYAFSIWVRSPSGLPLSGNLNLWALGGTSESISVPFTADGTWRLVTAPLTIRITGHTSLRAEMYMNTTGQYFDIDGASIVVGYGRS